MITVFIFEAYFAKIFLKIELSVRKGINHIWRIKLDSHLPIFRSAAESIEPSISREASSTIVEVKQIAVSTLPILRTSSLITGTERSIYQFFV
jgi:hypothetical protein